MRLIVSFVIIAVIMTGCTLRPTYMVGQQKIGSPEGVSVKFKNGNLPETHIMYRVFVDDPQGKHNIVVIRPGEEKSTPIRVPIGRVRVRYEVYHNAVHIQTRVRHILIDPPSPGIMQQLTILEP